MTQGVAMGYGADLVGWYAEANFADASFTTIGTPVALNGFGKVTEFTFTAGVERQAIRGVGHQKRQNDPIVSESFELSVSTLWQYDAVNDTIYDLITDLINNVGNSRKSYCVKVLAKPDGATEEFLYLLGVTLRNFSVALALDDTIKVEISFDVADIDDGEETSPARDWGTADIGTDPTNSSLDPTTYSGATITTWGITPSLIAQLQDFNFEFNVNPILIKNYTSKSHINQAQGAIDISYSGSAFGDGTSMGAAAIVNAVLSDSSGNIVIDIDGTYSFTLTAASYNSANVPIKEVDLTVIDFDGEANDLGIA